MAKYQAVKGMQDWYPTEFSSRQQIFDKIRTVAQCFGFQEIDSPAVETSALLTAKSGEEIKKQLFVLEQKGTEELALRFDLTVPMTRMLTEKQRELPKPVKWFALNRMWRYEAPQKGRLREFFQLSVELFGSSFPEADAECIILLLECIKSTGLKELDIVLLLGNRKLLQGLLASLAKSEQTEAVMRIVDKATKLSEEELKKELEQVGLTKKQISEVGSIIQLKGTPQEVLAKIRPLATSALAKEGLQELETVVRLVKSSCVQIDLSIVRGLAYYTGTVFECYDKERSIRALAGGGRYDNMVEQFGGEKTPAVGFGLGMATLMLLLEQKKLMPKSSAAPEYAVIAVTDEMKLAAQNIAARLRKKTSVIVDLMGRKFGKQLDYANTMGVKRIVFVGPEEFKRKAVKVKELSTGKEEEVLIDKL